MTATEFHWPIGRVGDRVLVVLREDADLLAPIFDGEPEPEDWGSGRWVPLGVPDFEIEPEQLLVELADGPDEVWILISREVGSTAAVDHFWDLATAFVEAGREPPTAAFLPEPLTLQQLVDELPSGRDATGPGRTSRHALLTRALMLCAVASMPGPTLASYLLSEANPRTHSGLILSPS